MDHFFNVTNWTQFFDPQGRTDIPVSQARCVTLRRCDFTCDTCFDMPPAEAEYIFDGLTLEDVAVRASEGLTLPDRIEHLAERNVSVTRR